MPFTYEYPRPAVTVDCVVFGLDKERLNVLLVQRKFDPFKGSWALPGGFIQMDEGLEDAARRELEEETGLAGVSLEQLHTFGDPGRDPRGRVITIAYYALVNTADHTVRAATDASDATWFSTGDLPPLAFDHSRILASAVECLQKTARSQPIGFELLPEEFTLLRLQRLYEIILERSLDKRNFRRKILGMDLLEELGETEAGPPRRPARLYRFDRKKYEALLKSGFHFEI
jgi:8-oxo-dGTP diphosphatase